MAVRKMTLFPDRIGVVIGREGETRKALEKALGIKISVNSQTGEVTLESDNVERLIRAEEVIKAINYGFSPDRAFKLLAEGNSLYLIDISAYVGKNVKDLVRVKGRIIGEKGKARRLIEETAKVEISVYRHYVAIIGSFESIMMAAEAIKRLIRGVPHKAVYNYLFAERRREKFRRMHMWG